MLNRPRPAVPRAKPCLAIAALVVAIAAPGCRRPGGAGKVADSATSLRLRPVAEGRPLLLATAVAGSADRSVARMAEVLKAIGLSQEPATIRAGMLAALRLPPPALALLRTDVPIAAVVLQAAPAPAEPTLVVAAAVDATRSAGLAQALGKVTARNLDATEIQVAGGSPRRVWLLVRDGVALLAESQAALIAGGALALEARAAGGDADLSVNVYPEALARAQDADLSMVVYRLKENFKVRWRAALEPDAARAHFAGPGLMDAVLDVISARAVEAASAGVELRVDPKRGIALLLRVQPRAGTAFARSAAVRSAYQLDPIVMSGASGKQAKEAPPVMVGAAGALPVSADLRRALTSAAAAATSNGAAGPGDAAWTATAGELAGQLTGATTTRADLTAAGLRTQYIFALVPGADPSRVMDLVTRLAQDQAASALLGAGLPPGKLKLKVIRQRGRLQIQSAALGRSLSAESREALRWLAPGDRVEVALGAAPGRLMAAVGPDAAARLERMLAAAAAPPAAAAAPAGPLGEALADSQGQDALVYLDLGALAKAIPSSSSASTAGAGARSKAATAGEPRGEPMPLFFVLRPGTTLGFDLRLPMATISRAARWGLAAVAAGVVPGLLGK